CLPAGVAQHHLAAAGTAVGEEAHAHDVASELLGGGNLDVDEDPRVEGVWRAQAIKPHSPIADIDDQGLVDVAGLRRAARIAPMGRDLVGPGLELVAGARAAALGYRRRPRL